MKSNIEELIAEIKKTFLHKKGLDAIIIFGSIARGEGDKRSDLDLCVIQSKNIKNEVSNEILDFEKKYNININVIFTDKNFKNIDKNLVEVILREGIAITGKMPDVSIGRLELEPYWVIKYDLSGLTHSGKMKLKRLLYGLSTKKKYKDKLYESKRKGIIEKSGGLRIGIASVLIPEKEARKIEKLLRDFNVSIRKFPVWMSKE